MHAHERELHEDGCATVGRAEGRDVEEAPCEEAAAMQRRRDEAQAIGDRIAELAAHIHAATYRLLVLLRDFEERGGWHGWVSCAQWLSWRTGIGLEAAREKVRVARVLPDLPRISEAFERGELSYSKVRAMTRIATPDTEEALLTLAIHGTAAQLERVVRGYRRAHPGETDEANRDHEARYLAARRDERGNVVIEARLPAELGARFLKALDAAVDADAFPRKGDESEVTPVDETADPRSWGQRRADALVLLADGALGAGLPGHRAADTHQVVVHVDAAVLEDPAKEGRSELEDGWRVSAETSRRLACDASVVTVREDEDGNALSVGRARRTVPAAIRRALANRDAGCRFPGCHHTRFLEAHHVKHWANGGETSLTNLVHLCSFHHRLLHEGGYRIEGTPDGELVFRNRYGLIEHAPRERGSFDELEAALAELDLGADTIPLWNGAPIDYGVAVARLCDLERRGLERAGR